ncbi:hypothetical protein NC652_007460 [Populus alba x Populus x berolinensis]|nr:hypothetical protein NC652_007460 [Populus alba x Populus x berolinensis]
MYKNLSRNLSRAFALLQILFKLKSLFPQPL